MKEIVVGRLYQVVVNQAWMPSCHLFHSSKILRYSYDCPNKDKLPVVRVVEINPEVTTNQYLVETICCPPRSYYLAEQDLEPLPSSHHEILKNLENQHG